MAVGITIGLKMRDSYAVMIYSEIYHMILYIYNVYISEIMISQYQPWDLRLETLVPYDLDWLHVGCPSS